MPEEKFSKNEDIILRRWIKEQYRVKFPQWYFWNLTPGEALQNLKREEPGTFSKLTAAEIERAARRN